MNLYVSTQEIKDFMGITSAAYDTKIAMFNKIATDFVNGIIGVSDLALHKVPDEAHFSSMAVYLNGAHIIAIGKIMDDDTEYVQTSAYDILSNRLKLASMPASSPAEYYAGEIAPRSLKITYAAGYNASGMAKISVSNVLTMAANATITLGVKNADGYTITRGTDWFAGADEKIEAENIALVIDAKAGTRAFALGADVYVIEDTNPQVTGRTIASSDAVRLKLSAATLAGVDFPEGIRGAIMLYVSNIMNISKNPRVKQYSIGGKSVTFSSEAEFNQFNELLKPYKRIGVCAI